MQMYINIINVINIMYISCDEKYMMCLWHRHVLRAWLIILAYKGYFSLTFFRWHIVNKRECIPTINLSIGIYLNVYLQIHKGMWRQSQQWTTRPIIRLNSGILWSEWVANYDPFCRHTTYFGISSLCDRLYLRTYTISRRYDGDWLYHTHVMHIA
jgi:hypothetical protein